MSRGGGGGESRGGGGGESSGGGAVVAPSYEYDRAAAPGPLEALAPSAPGGCTQSSRTVMVGSEHEAKVPEKRRSEGQAEWAPNTKARRQVSNAGPARLFQSQNTREAPRVLPRERSHI